MNKILLTSLRQISTPGGDVYHALKNSDAGYAGFGEAYFSVVDRGAVKGWKRHRLMTMNLIVACGSVRFMVFDEENRESQEFDLSADDPERYGRLTVAPGLWLAFGGSGPSLNLILNLASIEHDPTEADKAPLEAFPWRWPSST